MCCLVPHMRCLYTTLFRSRYEARGCPLPSSRTRAEICCGRLIGLLRREALPDRIVVDLMAERSVVKCRRSEEHTSELKSHCNLVCGLRLDRIYIADYYTW